MSLVGKYVAPGLIGVSSLVAMYKQFQVSRTSDFVKGSLSLAVGVALQVAVIHRSAVGGKPSNLRGVLAFLYPLLLLLSHVYSAMLYNNVPPRMLLSFLTGPSRLGASGNNHPVYQYRLSDVLDRVRDIVGDRIQSSADDTRER